MKACGISKMPLLIHYRCLPEGGINIKCAQLCHAEKQLDSQAFSFYNTFYEFGAHL